MNNNLKIEKEPIYWHMQIHPDFLDWRKEEKLLKEYNIIGLGITKDKQAYIDFENMSINDIVLIKRGSKVIALVEVTSNIIEVKTVTDNLDWFKYRRKIRILDFATSKFQPFPSPRGTIKKAINKDTPSYQYIDKWVNKIKAKGSIIEEIKIVIEEIVEKLISLKLNSKNINAFLNMHESNELSLLSKKWSPDKSFTLLMELGMVRDLISDYIDRKKNGITNNRQGIDYHEIYIEEHIYNIAEKMFRLQKENFNLKKLENELNEKNSYIDNLKQELKENINHSNNQTEINEKTELINIQENELNNLKNKIKEQEQYLEETNKIQKAITKLKTPAIELKESKKHYDKTRTNFNSYAENMFMLSGAMFGLIFTSLFIYFFNVGLNIKFEFGIYLLIVFPIIFPIIIGFLFLKQANLKSNEIEKINKRFILIHEVNQSLEALVEVNKGIDMDDKTEIIVNKLINNILDFASENYESNKQYNEVLELNNKIDSIINTIKTKKDAIEIAN